MIGGGDFVLCHPESKCVVDLEMRGVEFSFYGVAYVESLALLDRTNDLLGKRGKIG